MLFVISCKSSNTTKSDKDRGVKITAKKYSKKSTRFKMRKPANDVNADSVILDSDSDGVADFKDIEPNTPTLDTLITMVGYAYHEKVKITSETRNANLVDNTEAPKPQEKYIKGLLAYSVPSEMTVGKNYSIKIRITKDSLEKKTLIIGDTKIPINDTTIHSIITIESIRVSSVMSAALTTDNEENFKISSKSTETQNIENFGYTEWEWNVMPLKSGEHDLKLIIKVRITSEEGSFFKDIVVFEKKVPIKSNPSYSFFKIAEKYWQWSLSTLIIPFFIWLYNRKKKKEANPKDQSSN